MISIPDNIIKTINKILFDFLWNSKTLKSRKTTIISPIHNKRLAMVDNETVHQTAKIAWKQQLLSLNNPKWKKTYVIYVKYRFLK